MRMRQILKILARIAPGPAQFTKKSIFTLNGSRFEDLKSYINHGIRAEGQQGLIAQDSLNRLLSIARPEPPLAVISPLPPDDTGIANFTVETFKGAGYPVDL